MPTTIRAAVVERAGTAPQVCELTLGDVAPDEILVRNAACGICHTDIAYADGDLFDHFPVVLGHEIAGTVEAVGSAVTRFTPGDRVVLGLDRACGHCLSCESGRPVLCIERDDVRRMQRYFRDGEPVLMSAGGYAEAVITPAETAIPAPSDVPLNVAAVMGCAVSTGIGAAWHTARVRPGEQVAVFGAGGVGLSAIMGAKAAGADRICCIDPDPVRRERAIQMGATDAVAPEELDEQFDAVLECAGRTAVIEQGLAATRRGGRLVVIGAPRPGTRFTVDALELVLGVKQIRACLQGEIRPQSDFDAWFRLYRRGLLDLDALVTSTVELTDIATGFERSRSQDGIRTLVTFGGQL